jgi:hypothetical protein
MKYIFKAVNHKYFKREGSKGNYKYYYTEQEYNEAKKQVKPEVKAKPETKENKPEQKEPEKPTKKPENKQKITVAPKVNVKTKPEKKESKKVNVKTNPEKKEPEIKQEKSKPEPKNKISYSEYLNLKKEAINKYGNFGSDKHYLSGVQLNYIKKYPVESIDLKDNVVNIKFGGGYKKEIGPLESPIIFSTKENANKFLNVAEYLKHKLWGKSK